MYIHIYILYILEEQYILYIYLDDHSQHNFIYETENIYRTFTLPYLYSPSTM
jgi:hypothetical protein